MKETIVISLGGSLIVPDAIDTAFLRTFRAAVESHLPGKRFIIVTGGGRTARRYQHAAAQLGAADGTSSDWVGISATWLNARLVQEAFGDSAEHALITDPTKRIHSRKPILIAGGWKPGFSTDYDAVCLAQTSRAAMLINMSNVDFLYDKDPKRFPDAQKLTSASWQTLQKIVGTEWKAGSHVPFDPIATRKAAQLRLRLIFIGKDSANLRNVLEGKAFVGTVVE